MFVTKFRNFFIFRFFYNMWILFFLSVFQIFFLSSLNIDTEQAKKLKLKFYTAAVDSWLLDNYYKKTLKNWFLHGEWKINFKMFWNFSILPSLQGKLIITGRFSLCLLLLKLHCIMMFNLFLSLLPFRKIIL